MSIQVVCAKSVGRVRCGLKACGSALDRLGHLDHLGCMTLCTRYSLFYSFALSLLALSACNRGSAPAASDPEPAEGSTEMVGVPEGDRIISLIPSGTELIYAIGAGDDLVGRTMHCNYPTDVLAIPSVGSGLQPDIERMLSLRPTLVVASEHQAGTAEVLELTEAGVQVLLLPDQSLEDVGGSLALLGQRLQRVPAASALVRKMQQDLEGLNLALRDQESPSVIVAIGRDPLFVAGYDSFIGQLVEAAKGEILTTGDWVQLDEEFLAQQFVDVIIEPEGLGDEAFWDRYRSSLLGFRDATFCTVNADMLTRPGPRMAESAEAIARCLHGAEVVDAAIAARDAE
ncbi:MAG: iron complex transport system substrate-binding protein [Bradymonadia bacterium]|jgi:iron complex transport system substrate-binding protein